MIEQVGYGYETLKKRYANMYERMEKNGASACFSDDEEEIAEEETKETEVV